MRYVYVYYSMQYNNNRNNRQHTIEEQCQKLRRVHSTPRISLTTPGTMKGAELFLSEDMVMEVSQMHPRTLHRWATFDELYPGKVYKIPKDTRIFHVDTGPTYQHDWTKSLATYNGVKCNDLTGQICEFRPLPLAVTIIMVGRDVIVAQRGNMTFIIDQSVLFEHRKFLVSTFEQLFQLGDVIFIYRVSRYLRHPVKFTTFMVPVLTRCRFGSQGFTKSHR